MREHSDVIVWKAIGYKIYTSLVRIDGNLNADQYISDSLHSAVVPFLRDLSKFQENNAGSQVACRVLTFINTQGIRQGQGI